MSTTAAFPFAAVVFDLDGTLVDTEPAWDEVRRSLADQDGVAWPQQATEAMMGMSTQEWSSYLSDEVGLHSSPDESARRTIEALARRYREGRVTVLPGAREAVARMAALAPVGIASSSPVVLIESGIDALGIAELVRAHVSTEQVGRGKPAPDGYLRCCELLGVEPSDCLAVEDSSAGIRSALAAGMCTVAAPQPFHAPDAELLGRCAGVIETLDELTEEFCAGLAH